MKQLGLLVFLLLFIFGCRKYEKQQKELSFVEKIQNAHQKEKFNQEEAIQFDLKLSFGGEVVPCYNYTSVGHFLFKKFGSLIGVLGKG